MPPCLISTAVQCCLLPTFIDLSSSLPVCVGSYQRRNASLSHETPRAPRVYVYRASAVSGFRKETPQTATAGLPRRSTPRTTTIETRYRSVSVSGREGTKTTSPRTNSTGILLQSLNRLLLSFLPEYPEVSRFFQVLQELKRLQHFIHTKIKTKYLYKKYLYSKLAKVSDAPLCSKQTPNSVH